MRRLLTLSFVCLVGCQGTTGPFANKQRTDKADDPLFTIEEQQRRGRDRYPLPDDSPIGANTLTNRYGPAQ